MSRSLLQVVAEGYRLHDLLLDFARDRIGSTSLATAISLQTRFFGNLNVVVACMTPGINSEWSKYSFIALWGALEQVSGDGKLCIQTYNQFLLELEGGIGVSSSVWGVCRKSTCSEGGCLAMVPFGSGFLSAYKNLGFQVTIPELDGTL